MGDNTTPESSDIISLLKYRLEQSVEKKYENASYLDQMRYQYEQVYILSNQWTQMH